MRIDTNHPSATTSSNEQQQRVRSTLREMEPQDGLNAGPIQQGGATAQASATARDSQSAGVTDLADISAVAPSISDLATALQATPDVRQSKVQALRQAVDQGTYQVSSSQVAESMLAQATSKLR